MRVSLAEWISEAEALRYTVAFGSASVPTWLAKIQNRSSDFYISLVGELFDRMQNDYEDRNDWARLANAFAQFASTDNEVLSRQHIDQSEARLFAAGAFYIGGFPASAYLTMQEMTISSNQETMLACEDFLNRPKQFRSKQLPRLINALLRNNQQMISLLRQGAEADVKESLNVGPAPWIHSRLFQMLLDQFNETNLRAVLPQREDGFWQPLIDLFLSQTPPFWEFFPSQIEAINQGLFAEDNAFSIQMPTGAGKTTLCETLFFDHLRSSSATVAVLLVPYRSLASELRGSLVRRLRRLGITATTIYGGTVPVGDESASLDDLRALVATPEALSGLLGANPNFFDRVSLLVCDEGHLLDSDTRGVCLELILSRFKARTPKPPRFVFMSAIIPNIDEINTWLGGSENSVIRSEYRPAIAEFSTLRITGRGTKARVDLEINAQEDESYRYLVNRFLEQRHFRYKDHRTTRLRTYAFSSKKTLAVATARMALPMGTCAVFATNKTGNQGAIALAEELLDQLKFPLDLPLPSEYATEERNRVERYLSDEFGDMWVGTRIVAEGGVLHHGDIPQETREVLEKLIRNKVCRLVICTSTLAEGVNLPVRTLVLYSATRQVGSSRQAMLLRDIKNLVGRAGRPGSNTKGLVICVNERDWPAIERVALQEETEPVRGALGPLLKDIRSHLAQTEVNETLNNDFLEKFTNLHALVDGIDATLIELAAQEIGIEQLKTLADEIAEQTFAASQAMDNSLELLRNVFHLRSEKISAMNASGHLAWARATGARPRMIELVENGLLPLINDWIAIKSPLSIELIEAVVTWAFSLDEFDFKVREAYRLDEDIESNSVRFRFQLFVELWLKGSRFSEIARALESEVNDVLRIYSLAFSYSFQTVIEQGVSVLEQIFESREQDLPNAVKYLPEHLRHGVSERSALVLASEGIRHRQAAFQLGERFEVKDDDQAGLFLLAQRELLSNGEYWMDRWGELMYQNTLDDLDEMLGT